MTELKLQIFITNKITKPRNIYLMNNTIFHKNISQFIYYEKF